MPLLRPAVRRLPWRRFPIAPRQNLTSNSVKRRAFSSAKDEDDQLYRLGRPQQISLAENVRLSMRLLTHPIAIVTTPMKSDGDDRKEAGNVKGLVVSSFNTVSLTAPDGPIVSFNLKIPSKTYDAIKDFGAFDVSFPGHPDACGPFLAPQGSERMKDDDLRGLLANTSVFSYHCYWLEKESIEIADHIVMLGQVRSVSPGHFVDENGFVKPEGRPLRYHNGKCEWAVANTSEL